MTGWRKSSRSAANGNCLEAADWRASSFSNATNCIQVASGVLIRDSKLGGASPVLTFSGKEWRRFTAALKA